MNSALGEEIPQSRGVFFFVADMSATSILDGYDAIQIELMNEKCILLDEDDNVIGSESKKNCT